jgi:hypothetical protein
VVLLVVIPVVVAGYLLVDGLLLRKSAPSRSQDSAPHGSVLKTYDYSRITKDLESVGGDRIWHGEQEPKVQGVVQTDRIRVVPAQLLPGSGAEKPAGAALRVELKAYDGGHGDVTKTNGYAANRAEVYGRQSGDPGSTAGEWPDPEGSTRWYSFAVYLQSPWQFSHRDDHWLVVTQWKGSRSGSPPVALEIAADKWRLGGAGGNATLAPAKTDVWTRVEVGLHFSPDPDVGWAEVWMDGKQVLPRTHRATLRAHHGKTDPAYLKQGIYRSTRWKSTQVAYFGPLTIGTTREVVR